MEIIGVKVGKTNMTMEPPVSWNEESLEIDYESGVLIKADTEDIDVRE